MQSKALLTTLLVFAASSIAETQYSTNDAFTTALASLDFQAQLVSIADASLSSYKATVTTNPTYIALNDYISSAPTDFAAEFYKEQDAYYSQFPTTGSVELPAQITALPSSLQSYASKFYEDEGNIIDEVAANIDDTDAFTTATPSLDSQAQLESIVEVSENSYKATVTTNPTYIALNDYISSAPTDFAAEFYEEQDAYFDQFPTTGSVELPAQITALPSSLQSYASKFYEDEGNIIDEVSQAQARSSELESIAYVSLNSYEATVTTNPTYIALDDYILSAPTDFAAEFYKEQDAYYSQFPTTGSVELPAQITALPSSLQSYASKFYEDEGNIIDKVVSAKVGSNDTQTGSSGNTSRAGPKNTTGVSGSLTTQTLTGSGSSASPSSSSLLTDNAGVQPTAALKVMGALAVGVIGLAAVA